MHMSNPDIIDAAVIGVPDEKWGESVKALSFSKRGRACSDEIISYVKSNCRI